MRMTPGEIAFWEMIVAACVGGPDSADGVWTLDSMAVYAVNAVEERRKIVPIDPRFDAHSEADMILTDIFNGAKIDKEMLTRITRARTKIRGLFKSV